MAEQLTLPKVDEELDNSVIEAYERALVQINESELRLLSHAAGEDDTQPQEILDRYNRAERAVHLFGNFMIRRGLHE